MKKPPPPGSPPPSALDLFEGDWFTTTFPTLAEYLSVTAWDDGSPRETSTLLVFVEEGVWKGCIHDRAAGRSAWLSGAAPVALLGRLEDALRDETVEWRRRKPDAGGGGKRGR